MAATRTKKTAPATSTPAKVAGASKAPAKRPPASAAPADPQKAVRQNSPADPQKAVRQNAPADPQKAVRQNVPADPQKAVRQNVPASPADRGGSKKPLSTRIQQAMEGYSEVCAKERERFRPGAKPAVIDALRDALDGDLPDALAALYTIFDGAKGPVPSFAKVLAEKEPLGDDARVRFLATKDVATFGAVQDGAHFFAPFAYVEALVGGSKKDDAPIEGLEDAEGYVLAVADDGRVGYGYVSDGEFEAGFSPLADDIPGFFMLLAEKMKPKKSRSPLAEMLAPPPPPPAPPSRSTTGEPSPGAAALAAALLKEEKVVLEEDFDEDDLARAVDAATESPDPKHALRTLLEGETPIEESFLEDGEIHKIVRAFV